MVTADAVAQFGRDSRYFNTFAGNTVSCAAALAVLDTIADDGLIAHAAAIGEELRSGIAALVDWHEAIGDVCRTAIPHRPARPRPRPRPR